MPDASAIETLAEALVEEMISNGKTVALAESCTGGWIAKSITDVSGSSQCFAYGIVSYSNAAKESVLGVRPETLVNNGAVSEPTVREMAEGVLKLSGADMSVAVSGIAGPDGGSEEKPVGTVCFGWSMRRGQEVSTDTSRLKFSGDRDSVRRQAVANALQEMRERLRNSG